MEESTVVAQVLDARDEAQQAACQEVYWGG